MTTIDYINSTIAILAFLLSIWNFITTRIDKKPKLKTTLNKIKYRVSIDNDYRTIYEIEGYIVNQKGGNIIYGDRYYLEINKKIIDFRDLKAGNGVAIKPNQPFRVCYRTAKHLLELINKNNIESDIYKIRLIVFDSLENKYKSNIIEISKDMLIGSIETS